MKNHLSITVAAALASLLMACQPSTKTTETTAASKDSTTIVAGSDTAKAYNAYLKVKDDLVKTDGKAAKTSSASLAAELGNIKGCTEAADLATKMAATDDVTSQRTLFLQLSQDIIPLVKGMKEKVAPIYVAYCPMAGDGKGGYWLSAQKEIRNPYYGDEMMECGEVKEELK
jgi:hypothetical protein